MSPDSSPDLFSPRAPHEPRDPMVASRDGTRPALPRRFFAEAGIGPDGHGHRLLLDGKPARSPGGRPLARPSAALMAAIAAEWQAQEVVIDPAAMPLTKLVNAAIDGVALQQDAVVAEMARYAGTDMLCYRAEAPDSLVARQAALWDPWLDWAEGALGARLLTASGVIHLAQPDEAVARLAAEAARPRDVVAVAALGVLTSLTGSLVMALALEAGAFGAEDGWQAANLDEIWQAEVWGEDAEARARLAGRRRSYDAALRALALIHAPTEG